jgi:GWxTD domain-containing protein
MKMKNTLITVVTLILISSVNIYSQKLAFNYDYAYFKGDETSVYVEFYYSFMQSGLKFIRTVDGFRAMGMLRIDITDVSANKDIILKEFHIPLDVKDTTADERGRNLVGQLNILLKPGNYRMKLFAADFNDTLDNFSGSAELNVQMFSGNNVTISSVQLANNISKSSNTESIFYKNTLEVVPNPALLFGNNISKVFYYTEFYNLKPENITNDYIVVASMLDKNGAELKSETFKYQLKSDSRVVHGSFDIGSLPTESYKVNLALFNSKSEKLVEQNKQFWVFNQDSVNVSSDENEGYLTSEYPGMTEKQLLNEFEKSKYLMVLLRERLIDEFENIQNLDSKKQFMYNFWKQLDPNKSTVQNERKIDYFNRIDYANKHYKNDFIEGWKTDRGRIYITYGPYTNIDRYPFQANERAYEIWSYDNIQGGTVFVFVDLSNNDGNYVLVHSTARGELRDDEWRNRLDVR